MNIICQYNKELEHFLENAVEYTLHKYGEELNLVNLQEIELMDISEFDLQKDGTTYENGTKIIVTSRLYDMLPFDEPEKLSSLYEIMNRYYKQFRDRYLPKRKWIF